MPNYFSKQSVISALFVLLVFSAGPARAALNKLPFIGDKFTFDINLTGETSFDKNIVEAIRTQRKGSVEFKAMTSPLSAERFDRDVIARWLESEGFFDFNVSSAIADNHLTYTIDTGPRYLIQSLKIAFPDNIPLPSKTLLKTAEGEPLRAEDVLNTQSQLKDYIQSSQCLYKIQLDYYAEVNHQTHKAFLTFRLEPSNQVTFGPPQIVGATDIERDYLQNFLTFKPGECFKRKKIEFSRLALLQSNLLSRVDIAIAEPNNQQVIVSYDVTERRHRTIKAGLGYDSNTELGLTLGWQHRNLLHRGERLDIDSHFNQFNKDVSAELVKPHFLQTNQTLTLTSKLAQETSDGYIYTSGEVGAGISRPLANKWAGSIGSNLEFSRDKRDGDKSDFALLSAPLSLNYNPNNQVLDPINGWAISIQLQPFIDLYNTKTQFTKSSAALSAYFSARSLPGRPTLALRSALGSISGESLDAIPSAHRYYVGGGGSVRGYRYQSVGDLSEDEDNPNVPLGGLSFAEAAAELRLRFSNSWGAALFVDGGYAYPGKRPTFGEDFLWGAGLGVRYFTSFAPIRFDIATPLNPRKNKSGKTIDDKIQLYISIGQAF